MNRLSTRDRAKIIGLMVEGMSVRGISRITGASKNTIAKLLRDVGTACAAYQYEKLVKLPCTKIQVDEIWSFVGAKAANVSEEKKAEGWGDCWTWTAICADTKLIPSWFIGPRNADAAYEFLSDLSRRLANRVQLTSDGFRAYPMAVYAAFDTGVDYAQLVKVYGPGVGPEGRYSPPECIGARKQKVIGNPAKEHVSTSFAERQNLSMRMSMRRFTRLTNAFSKKLENHCHAIAIYFMHYNFARIHQTLRVTPAMEAKVTDHLWSLEEIAALAD